MLFKLSVKLNLKRSLMHISFSLLCDYIHSWLHEAKKYKLIMQKFLIFALGAFLTRGINLLLAPLTMHILTPIDYGLLALANSFISILTAVVGLGLRQMLPLHYFHLKNAQRWELLVDISSIYVICNLPLFCVLYFNIVRLNNYIFLGQASQTMIAISLSIAFMYFFVELYYQLLQYNQQAVLLTCVQIVVALSCVVLNLFFLFVLHKGVSSVLLSQAIGMAGVCVFVLKVFINKGGLIHISRKRIASSFITHISNGLPFIPSMLCGLLLASGDRWLLSRLSTMHNVGIYSVANTLAQCANMVAFYAITGSYMPYMLNAFASEYDIVLLEQANKRAMWSAMIVSFILLTAGFASCKSYLYWFIPHHFHASIDYMYMLLIGSIFLLGTYFLNCLIQYQKKSIFLGFILCLPAVINLLLNWLLIPYFQLQGCVLATLISYMIYFLVTYAFNMRLIKEYQ